MIYEEEGRYFFLVCPKIFMAANRSVLEILENPRIFSNIVDFCRKTKKGSASTWEIPSLLAVFSC
jgi:hypothetical protein